MAIPTNLTDEGVVVFAEKEFDLARRAHELKPIVRTPVGGNPNDTSLVIRLLDEISRTHAHNALVALLVHAQEKAAQEKGFE